MAALDKACMQGWNCRGVRGLNP